MFWNQDGDNLDRRGEQSVDDLVTFGHENSLNAMFARKLERAIRGEFREFQIGDALDVEHYNVSVGLTTLWLVMLSCTCVAPIVCNRALITRCASSGLLQSRLR